MPILLGYPFRTITTSILHISPTGNTNRLPTNIAEQRTHDRQHRTRRLRRRPRPAERDILEGILPRFPTSFLRLRNSQRDFLPVGSRHERTLLLRSRQPRSDVAERDGVGAHAEGRAPFFRDRFRQPDDACFRQSVVRLACVAV